MNTDDFKTIWGKFRNQVEKNKKLKRLYKLAEDGKATYEDARALSSVLSDIIVDSTADMYPGQIGAIMQALQDGTLGKQYFKELSGYVTQVQQSYNESLGIGLKPVEVNTNRQLLSNDFIAGEDYQKAVSAMRRRSELSSNQFVDYAQKANAEFQSNDFKITVSRIYDGIGLSDNRSCKWCLERCGKNVPYEKAVAMGMFQRHEGCHCVIEYNNNGTKTYQSGKGGRDSFTTRKPARFVATDQQRDDKGDIHTARDCASRLINLAKKKDDEITPVILEATNETGGHLEGLKHRIKSLESLERKILTKSSQKGLSVETYAGRVTDVLRYTNVSETEKFTSNFFSFQKRLEKDGLNIIECTNTFRDGEPYKGINTLIKDSDGYIFELQFHTNDSLRVKEINHRLYEKERDPLVSKGEKLKLKEQMRKNSKQVENPKNVAKIKDIARVTDE